jgi:hypothetical protein
MTLSYCSIRRPPSSGSQAAYLHRYPKTESPLHTDCLSFRAKHPPAYGHHKRNGEPRFASGGLRTQDQSGIPRGAISKTTSFVGARF